MPPTCWNSGVVWRFAQVNGGARRAGDTNSTSRAHLTGELSLELRQQEIPLRLRRARAACAARPRGTTANGAPGFAPYRLFAIYAHIHGDGNLTAVMAQR